MPERLGVLEEAVGDRDKGHEVGRKAEGSREVRERSKGEGKWKSFGVLLVIFIVPGVPYHVLSMC